MGNHLISNKLIAQFMGWVFKGHEKYIEWFGQHKYPDAIMAYNTNPFYGSIMKFEQWLPLDQFEYHKNWQWLMVVVKNIEERGCIIQISLSLGTVCKIMELNGKNSKGKSRIKEFSAESNEPIEAVYTAVVDFVKWYNKKNGK